MSMPKNGAQTQDYIQIHAFILLNLKLDLFRVFFVFYFYFLRNNTKT